jgi:hypothetical protein
LEGSALLVIEGLALTEENYKVAMDILKKPYGNTQVVISAHMYEVLKLLDCSTGKVRDLRRVCDKIDVNVRVLEALGVKSEQYGSLLIPVICQSYHLSYESMLQEKLPVNFGKLMIFWKLFKRNWKHVRSVSVFGKTILV